MRFLVLIILVFSCSFINAQDLTVPIDKGIIVGKFDISIIDKNIQLNQNQYFKLSDYSIKASDGILCEEMGTMKSVVTTYYTLGTVKSKRNKDAIDLESFTKVATSKFGKEHLVIYKIKVNQTGNEIPYYGMICFFSTDKKHQDKPECGYYRISMPDESFQKAKADVGYVSSYEYYLHNGRFKSGFFAGNEIKQPTWIMFISNTDETFSHLGIEFSK